GCGVLLGLVLENRLDLESQLLLRQRHEPRGFGKRPLLPGAAIEPDFRRRNTARDGTLSGERTIDRLLAHPVRAVRIREIAGNEDQVGLELIEQRADDADVGGAHRILAYLPGSIEWQVEKARIVGRESEDCDAAHRFGLANIALDVLHVPRVHVAGNLAREKLAHAPN